jgi:trimeric autotransporter adhesin
MNHSSRKSRTANTRCGLASANKSFRFVANSRLLQTGLALLVCAFLGSCHGFFINPTVSSIYVNPASATVAVGGTVQLTATATYSDGTQSTITSSNLGWSSSDTTIATITSPGGLVRGIATGSATITASYQGGSGTATVTVSPSNVTSLCITTTQGSASCSQTTATISGTPGTLQFYAYANGSASNDVTTAVSWSSSNTTVATIGSGSSSAGLVSATTAGTTSITATITNTSTGAVIRSQTIVLTVS